MTTLAAYTITAAALIVALWRFAYRFVTEHDEVTS